MYRPSRTQHSIAWIFVFSLLLLATAACAGGADQGDGGDGGNGTEVADTDRGNGNGNGNGDNGRNQDADSPCKGANVTQVDVTLTPPSEEGADWGVAADPDTVTIERRGQVCWNITGLESGYTLTMKGKTPEDDQFPERSVSPPPSFIISGVANRPGTFTYGLYLTDSDGNPVGELDPQIIINPDPG